MKLSQSSLRNVAVGTIINLMSNDVQRFDMAPQLTHFIWIMPIQLGIISYLMFQTMGWAAFAGIAIVAIQAIPIQGNVHEVD